MAQQSSNQEGASTSRSGARIINKVNTPLDRVELPIVYSYRDSEYDEARYEMPCRFHDSWKFIKGEGTVQQGTSMSIDFTAEDETIASISFTITPNCIHDLQVNGKISNNFQAQFQHSTHLDWKLIKTPKSDSFVLIANSSKLSLHLPSKISRKKLKNISGYYVTISGIETTLPVECVYNKKDLRNGSSGGSSIAPPVQQVGTGQGWDATMGPQGYNF